MSLHDVGKMFSPGKSICYRGIGAMICLQFACWGFLRQCWTRQGGKFWRNNSKWRRLISILSFSTLYSTSLPSDDEWRHTNAIRMPSSLLNNLPEECWREFSMNTWETYVAVKITFIRVEDDERCKEGTLSTETAGWSMFAMMTLHLHNESAKWNFFHALAFVLLPHVAQQCQALPFCHRLHDLLDDGWFTPPTMNLPERKISNPLSWKKLAKRLQQKRIFSFETWLAKHVLENELLKSS